MTATHKNFLKTTISAVASSGLGALTISTASSGYRTFGAGDDGKTFDGITIREGTAWEVCDGCVYTHSGTSLSRGTRKDSSTGSAIAFTSAAVVEQNPAAGFADMAQLAMASVMPGGRLTLESGVPVSTTDQTAKTSVYYTPSVHNVVPLWDGYKWVPVEFTETTLALGTLTSGKPYDVFAYLSGGALALESLAWTSDSARATAVTLQDGRYCKSGDKTRLLLGTFYTTSTTTTEDSRAKRLVGNVYNTVARGLYYASGAASHSYTNATRRYWNNTSASRLEAMLPLGAAFNASVSSDVTGTNPRVELSLNDTSGSGSFVVLEKNATSGIQITGSGAAQGVPGFNFLAALEVSATGGSYDYLFLSGSVSC